MMIGFCGNIENIDCKFREKKFQHEKEKIVTNLYETLINGKALMIHVLNWFFKEINVHMISRIRMDIGINSRK